MVCAPLYGFSCRALLFPVEYLAGHQFGAFHTFFRIASSHAADAFSIVVHSGNRTGHMRTMVLSVDIVAGRREIVAVRIVTGLLRIFPHIGLEVFMIIVNAAVNHADNYISGKLRIVRVVPPYRENIYVTATYRR